jgi:hypothetical protein
VSSVDWVDHATYNVLPLPTETPLDGPRQILTDPADPVTSPFGWHDTDGVAGAEFTDTRGNNVSAQDDVDNNDTGGTRADGGASLNFDFPLDLTQAPSGYRAAAITNLFYLNNTLHDIHARYGFTEAAGNFQVKNYSGAGLANDAVQADAQDGGGTNNANFGTPPDGQAPRMQMYIFNYTSPNGDGDLDNQIVIHEYGHGVSTACRPTGGMTRTRRARGQRLQPRDGRSPVPRHAVQRRRVAGHRFRHERVRRDEPARVRQPRRPRRRAPELRAPDCLRPYSRAAPVMICPIVIRCPSGVRTPNSRIPHGLSATADDTSTPRATTSAKYPSTSSTRRYPK